MKWTFRKCRNVVCSVGNSFAPNMIIVFSVGNSFVPNMITVLSVGNAFIPNIIIVFSVGIYVISQTIFKTQVVERRKKRGSQKPQKGKRMLAGPRDNKPQKDKEVLVGLPVMVAKVNVGVLIASRIANRHMMSGMAIGHRQIKSCYPVICRSISRAYK